jgi:predicted GNAT family acetyltransferase
VEQALIPLGYAPAVRVDFFLMACDEGGSPSAPARRGILVRPAALNDYDALLEMQIAYEKEEVATNPRRYRPESAKASLAHILQHETILVAEYQGNIVGKINTNARSFTRRQLGGVYVKPSHRRMGVASAMVGAMKDKLNRKSLSLYVRKANNPAMLVYAAAGFKTIADYRITYFNPVQE